MRDANCELRDGMIREWLEIQWFTSPEKKLPDSDSGHLEKVLVLTGKDNFDRRYKMAADPVWITM